MQSFADLDLLASLKASLDEQHLETLTEIQHRAIPLLLAGQSLVGVAETGSGKTLTYALPILHMMKTLENGGSRVELEGRPRAVVIVPTRELGEQVSKVFKTFTHTTRLRVRTVLGGTDIAVAKNNVAGAFEVLVSTPGRIIKLLDRGLVHFDDVRILAFDEADQMLDDGFLPNATQIVAACPEGHQLALFSATLSASVAALTARLFAGAPVIRSAGSHKVVSTLNTQNRPVVNGERAPLLRVLVGEKVRGGTIVFANTRDQCDAIGAALSELGASYALYRGAMDKVLRRTNLRPFRNGEMDFLVSTDLASRGLDVDHVGRVVNYHLPKEMESYLHRVGRTARAGRTGLVVNFVTERDAPLLNQLAASKAGKPSTA